MSFNGSNWGNVGTLVGISTYSSSDERIAFSPSGIPYVAFNDYSSNPGKLTVMSFNGGNWGVVGSIGISAAQALELSLEISPYGTPYVAYSDAVNSSFKSIVMSFDGINWGNVGGVASVNTPAIYYQSFKIHPITAEPYLLYADRVNQLSYVQKYADITIPVISATISGSNLISLPRGNITLTSTFSPPNASTLVSWNTTLNGIASFNTITGVLMALQNGDGVVAVQSRYSTITSNIMLVTITNNKVNQTVVGLANITSIIGFNTILPATATSGLLLNYTSTNPTIASVLGTNLKFYAVGVATITASNLDNLTFNGINQSFVVTVLSNIFPVVSATVLGSNTIITNKGTTQLTGSYNPGNANSNTILGWSVSNTSIATISGTGLLQAINNGVVTVAGSYGTVTGIKVVTISGQCLPYNLTVTASNTSVCPIENIGFTVTGANNYTWNNRLNNGTTNIASFNPTVSGIITFVGTNQFGCISNSTSSYVVNPLTIILTQPQSTTYTAGNFATLNVSAIGSNLSYLWSNGNTSNQFTTTVVGTYQVTVSGTCGVEISNNSSVTRSTNSYLFVPSAINISVGDTVTLDVKTASNAPLEFSINDNTIANLLGPTVIGLKAGNATVSVSQPATPTSDALPIRNIPLNVSSEPKRNFDIIGNNLVPVGTIIIYSQPSVLGFSYSWSFTGVGMQIISRTENTPNLQIVFLSSASVGNIICVVRDNNQNIVSNKSLRENTISNEEAESIRNLPKVECPAEVTDCKNSYITSVKIGKLKNENTGCSRAGYGDYTTNRKIDTLFMGDSYDLSLGSVALAGKSSFFAVWIDYNNNGKFTDQEDFLAASFENSAAFEIKNLVIKNQDAYAGVRRLRVSMRADAAISASDPCAKTGSSGETEDYLVFIRKPDDLEAPNFLTPNRDGKNDFFLVRGINPKLPNKLTIMDRLGTLIYEKENYKNDWEAKSDDNKNVQDGTYYYFFSNGEKNIKGFVEIRRK